MAEATLEDVHFYIHATPTPADDRTRVLKHGDTFGVFNRYGDIRSLGLGEQGLYHAGTRFLSQSVMTIDDGPPILLNSAISADTLSLTVNLTTVELERAGEIVVPQDTVFLVRSRFLWENVCYERIEVTNYGVERAIFELRVVVDSDFADIFEVRGTSRRRRGELLPPTVADGELRLIYRGLDGVTRRTRIQSPDADDMEDTGPLYIINLGPRERREIDLLTICEVEQESAPLSVELARRQALQNETALQQEEACISTDNEQFNAWLERSSADLRMLTTRTPHGLFPYAGVPWFNTAFGRDGIITALEMLPLKPDIARGVLCYLAATQATDYDRARDAEPGKILHETRTGEMAALGEHPFERYYGSVDATPLYVVLAGAHFDWTADRDLIEQIWPNIQAAIAWIDRDGDLDDDGFIEYAGSPVTGLVNQGWQDSHDSIFHADGTLASGPIALCEAQGYVYAARLAIAHLARVRGDHRLALEQEQAALQLRARFDERFWDEEMGTYVLALDGQKRPCRVSSSNPGHCLFTGIALDERRERLARTLLSDEMFSGWGVRTKGANSALFNPMSYHNGSVWPHDNALIMAGLAMDGQREAATRILEGLFAASHSFDLRRMPELFCGFQSQAGAGPTLYPVACLPQAWAAGAVFLMLQAALGLQPDAGNQRLSIIEPFLPSGVNWLRIDGLQVGHKRIQLEFEREGSKVQFRVPKRDPNLEIIIQERR